MTWIDDELARNPEPEPLKLPQRFAEANYEGIPDGPLKEAALAYLKTFYAVAPLGIGCLFLGQARRFKTYTAAFLLRQIHHSGKLGCLFVQCPVVFSRLERNRFAAESDALIAKIIQTPLVCLDDFAVVEPRSFGATVLAEIAEGRFAEERPTIWTGNLTATDEQQLKVTLASNYGNSVARRIYDGTKGFRVRL